MFNFMEGAAKFEKKITNPPTFKLNVLQCERILS